MKKGKQEKNNSKETKLPPIQSNLQKGSLKQPKEKEMKVILTSEMCSIINNNFKFYESIINLYLENTFIPLSTKIRLKTIKQTIKEKEKIFFKN